MGSLRITQDSQKVAPLHQRSAAKDGNDRRAVACRPGDEVVRDPQTLSRMGKARRIGFFDEPLEDCHAGQFRGIGEQHLNAKAWRIFSEARISVGQLAREPVLQVLKVLPSRFGEGFRKSALPGDSPPRRVGELAILESQGKAKKQARRRKTRVLHGRASVSWSLTHKVGGADRSISRRRDRRRGRGTLFRGRHRPWWHPAELLMPEARDP